VRLIVEEGYSPAENMARDEALFRAFANTREPVWRIYTWDRPAVTFGRLQKYPEGNVAFPVIRRLTGGGLVPHGTDLTYCVVQERRRGHENYRHIVEMLAEALRRIGVECAVWEEPERGNAGRCFASLAPYDIHVNGRKLAGCAQYRVKGAVMHHGSIANGVPPDELRALDVWDGAAAVAVEELLGRRLKRAELAAAIERAVTHSGDDVGRGKLSGDEEKTAGHLYEKYESGEWNKDAFWKS
jgi:lipoate-protein ligase A